MTYLIERTSVKLPRTTLASRSELNIYTQYEYYSSSILHFRTRQLEPPCALAEYWMDPHPHKLTIEDKEAKKTRVSH